MLLVGSENAAVGLAAGMRVLRRGGRALDAVEATIRRVESNPADHRVPRMNLVAVHPRDGHVAMTTVTTGVARYVYQTGSLDGPVIRPRQVIPLDAARRLAGAPGIRGARSHALAPSALTYVRGN